MFLRFAAAAPAAPPARPRVRPLIPLGLAWALLVASLGAPLLVGCDSASIVTLDGSTPSDGSAPSVRLEMVSASPITLAPEEGAPFAVRLLDARSRPIVGVTLRFALEGRPEGSSLGALDASTDAMGVARGELVAGPTPTTFLLRVTADGAAPLYVDVAVGTGFGALRVSPSYSGARTGERIAVALHAGLTCDAVRPGTLPARELPLVDDATDVVFGALPVSISWAVVAKLVSASGDAQAWGCVDDVQVGVGAERSIEVQLSDVPLSVDGAYSVRVSLDATAATGEPLMALRAATISALDAVGGDEALLLEALGDELRSRGQSVAADELVTGRIEAEATLEGLLELEAHSPSTALLRRIDEVQLRCANVAIDGTLALPSMGSDPTLVVSSIALGTGGDALLVDARAARLAEAPLVDARIEGDVLEVADATIDLPLGRLAEATLAAMARAGGYASPLELVAADAGCPALGAFVATRSWADRCDGTCVADACKTATERLWTAAVAGMGALDSLRAELSLSGAITLGDADGDLTVDALRAEALDATWSSLDGASSAPVGAALEGVRALP